MITYGSRTLTKSEQNYCTTCTCKKMLAMVNFIEHFYSYLLGQTFIVRTDHTALEWLHQFENQRVRLQCGWSYRRVVFSYGFYFCKLTCIQKLNPNKKFCTILYCMRAYRTIRKLNPNVNLKYEILSCLKFPFLRYFKSTSLQPNPTLPE